MRLHMQDILDFARCEQKSYYSLWRGFRRRETLGAMWLGKLIHEGLAAGYQNVDANIRLGVHEVVSDFVLFAGNAIDWHRTVENSESCDLALEVCAYYWGQLGHTDKLDRIIRIEQPITVALDGHFITCSFDFLGVTDGETWIWDHKTTDNVGLTFESMPLDIQINTYLWAYWKSYGETARLQYNIIRRAVPRELTKSGRKSTASKDPKDYLRRVWVTKTEAELMGFQEELVHLLNRMEQAGREHWWKRTPIKSGGDACAQCPYKDVCIKEFSTGRKIDDATASMLFEIGRREGSEAPCATDFSR